MLAHMTVLACQEAVPFVRRRERVYKDRHIGNLLFVYATDTVKGCMQLL
jgi:hypothetical protein